MTFRQKWAYMFNDDEEVVKLVASVLPFLALSQVRHTYVYKDMSTL
jgi:MATE family multidrug resistance protein